MKTILLRMALRALVFSVLIGCEAAPIGTSQITLTEEIEPGIVVRSSVLNEAGDVESQLYSEISRATLAQAWYLAHENQWDYVVLPSTAEGTPAKRGEVLSEAIVQAPSLAELNMRLVERWRGLKAGDLKFADFDDPGCDAIGEGDGIPMWVAPWNDGIDGNNHCMQNCCAMHDICFAENRCTIKSLVPIVGLKENIGSTLRSPPLTDGILPGCYKCNVRVGACLGACRTAPRLAEKFMRKFKINDCPVGQHRCFDVECSSATYCRADCYKEPTPCEESTAQATGQKWCQDECRDTKGRKGYLLPTGVACDAANVVEPCDCSVVDKPNQYHGRCSDSSCSAGQLGFCSESCGTAGNVPDSPCCGGAGQACCAEKENNNSCDGNGRCISSKCCAPKTAAQACGTNKCGTAPDGCGGTVSCGSCAGGQTCSAGQCVCVPKTKAQACGSNTCGTAADGCGGTISCGTCNSGFSCSSGQCVAIPPPPASFTWSGLNHCGGGDFLVTNTGGSTGTAVTTMKITDCFGIYREYESSRCTLQPGQSCTMYEPPAYDLGHELWLNGTKISYQTCFCP